MKRIAILFAVVIVAFSVAIYLKVRANSSSLLGPTGSSGIVEGTEVDISARLSSRVVRMHATRGQTVKAGDVLVELDCTEPDALLSAAAARHEAAQRQAEAAGANATSALAAIDSASANVGAAGAQRAALAASKATSERQVKRLTSLEGSGGATEVDLERASTQATQLSEQVRALDSQIRAARGQTRVAKGQAEAARAQAEAAKIAIVGAEADVVRARNMVAECKLTTPIAGIVSVRAFEPGEVVMPGARLMTIVRIDEVEVTFYVPNAELGTVAVERPVTIIADAYPDEHFAGTIEWVSPEAEFTPRNVQTREDRDRLVYAVRAVLPNPDARLRPGMPVEVMVDGSAQQ